MAKFDKFINRNKKRSRSSKGRLNAKSNKNTKQETSVKSGKISKPQRSKRHKKLKHYEEPDPDGFSSIWASQWKANQLKEANQKPRNDTEQEIPHAILEIQKWKQQSQTMKKPKRRKKNKDRSVEDDLMNKQEKGMTRPLKPVPVFKQKEKESDIAFFRRIDREAHAIVKKSQFEDHFKVDVDKHDSVEDAMQKKVGKKKRKEHNRLKEKKLKKKEKVSMKKDGEQLDFSHFNDRVEFGEVAMQPPSLTSKPRKAEKTGKGDRPGKKSLLLHEIVSQNIGQGRRTTAADKRAVGQTTKRKNMSLAQQRLTDTQRNQAIELYRDMKKNKMKT